MADKRIIVLPHGGRSRLAKQFGTTYVTVCSALNFKTNSRFAIMLRHVALERGGVVFYNDKPLGQRSVKELMAEWNTPDEKEKKQRKGGEK